MRRLFLLAALMSCESLSPGNAGAVSLEVAPVLISLAPGQTSATIEIENHGAGAAAIQARAFVWSQSGDDDTLTPTKDVILSPPIFTIAKDGSQTLRLLLRGAASGGQSRNYRLLLDEVPAANSHAKQLVVALRLSIPIFTSPAEPRPATLQWRAEREPNGDIVLSAANGSQAYAVVTEMDITMPDGSHPTAVSRGTNRYVLPGAQRDWTVPGHGAPPGATLQLTATTQWGKSSHSFTP